MKTKVKLYTILILSFALICSGFIYSGNSISDYKKIQSECSYLQGKVDKSDSECPYLSGKTICLYSGKESKTELENSIKDEGKQKKFYRTIKNITT